MGILSGYKYRKVIRKLRSFGFEFLREAKGSHEIWYNEEKDLYTTVPHHTRDIPEGTLHEILKQCQIKPKDFVEKK